MLLSAWAALRFGEVTELRRKDISVGCESVIISRGVTHRDGCHIDTTTTSTSRTVVLPSHIRAEIKHHLDTFVGPESDASVSLTREVRSPLTKCVP